MRTISRKKNLWRRISVDIADFDLAYDDKVKEIARDKISEKKGQKDEQ